MKIQSLVTAVVAASVAGVAFAGGPDHHKQTVKPLSNAMMSGVVQGNSVWPSNMLTLLNGRLTVGALANLDGYWSSNTQYTLVPEFGRYLGADSNASAIYLNNANVFVGSDFDFAHARLNLGYFDRRTVTTPAGPAFGGQNNFTLDEGYVSLYDAKKMPVYLKAGKFYDSVGSYNPYQLVPDLTNLFTQLNATGVEVGAVLPMGLYASVTGFSSSSSAYSTINQSRVDNFSAKAGYAATNNGVHWGVDLGYIAKMSGLVYLNSNDYTANIVGGAANFSSNSAVLAGDGFVKVSDFDFVGKYAQFNDSNMTLTNPQSAANPFPVDSPWALVLGAGYSFHTKNHPSRFGVGYQMSRGAQYLFMPKSRYLADYNVGLNKYLSFQLAYYYDQNYVYGAPVNATDRNYANGMTTHNNLLAARLSVSF